MRHPATRRLYLSPNGDTWFLVRDPTTGVAFVRHQANPASGGQVTDMDLGAFLSGPRHPEHEAVLRLIGSFIVDPQGGDPQGGDPRGGDPRGGDPRGGDPRGDDVEEETAAVDTGGEWSDAELKELGTALVRGLSIEEIARLLRRGHNEVRDKVAEVGRACRGVAAK